MEEDMSDAPAGIPSETSWRLPNGLQCHDLPPDGRDIPPDIATISYPQLAIRPGLELYSFTAKIRTPLTVIYDMLSSESYLWLALNFHGTGQYLHEAVPDGMMSPDRNYCALLRDPVTALDYGVGGHMAAGMAITSRRLRHMLQGQRLTRPINAFLDGRFDPSVVSGPPTAAQRLIAEQICRNPYDGAMKTVFLEGKAFEMLAETLRVVFGETDTQETGRTRHLALAAREIMMADLANPPRIADVARQVGLSQRRLNEVFQEVFDAGPLACLVRWRLDVAQQRLAAGEASVKQVAHQLGYAHVSNFSLAFARRFGHPPTGPREKDRTSGSGDD